LSLHLKSGAGSSLKGWKITIHKDNESLTYWTQDVCLPCTSTWEEGWMIPLFGRTQYCFGAVVLTLKAIGSVPTFLTCRNSSMGCVNGPKGEGKNEKISSSGASSG
jgi:hypothetical protein